MKVESKQVIKHVTEAHTALTRAAAAAAVEDDYEASAQLLRAATHVHEAIGYAREIDGSGPRVAS